MAKTYAVETRCNCDARTGFWFRAAWKMKGMGSVRIVEFDEDDLELTDMDGEQLFRHEYTENHDLIIFEDAETIETLIVDSYMIEV